MPLSEDIDWEFLAEKFGTVRRPYQKHCAGGCLYGRGEDSPVRMRHLLRAAVGELKKNEIVVVREELREYADLLDTEED